MGASGTRNRSGSAAFHSLLFGLESLQLGYRHKSHMGTRREQQSVCHGRDWGSSPTCRFSDSLVIKKGLAAE